MGRRWSFYRKKLLWLIFDSSVATTAFQWTCYVFCLIYRFHLVYVFHIYIILLCLSVYCLSAWNCFLFSLHLKIVYIIKILSGGNFRSIYIRPQWTSTDTIINSIFESVNKDSLSGSQHDISLKSIHYVITYLYSAMFPLNHQNHHSSRPASTQYMYWQTEVIHTKETKTKQ
jgi:hypothetical protein